MKHHFVPNIDSSSAACTGSIKGTYGKLWPVPRNAIHRQREQREAHRTDLAAGGRELQKIKCTCFIEGVFTSRIRSCLTLLKPYSGVAFLEQLPNGLVQTAAREHQKVKQSSTDKHPNCLILSYP